MTTSGTSSFVLDPVTKYNTRYATKRVLKCLESFTKSVIQPTASVT